MPRRSGRSSGRSSSARRRTTWATVTGTTSVAAANGFVATDLLTQYRAVLGADTAGVTIARAHLHYSVTAGLTAIGNNIVHGIIVTDLNDVGANIAGSPRPASDLNADWMWWEWKFTDVSGNLEPGGAANWDVDLRGKRKMHQVGQTLVDVMQVPASAAFPVTVQVTGRILLMLP
jgi:hypothetical protein